MSTYQTGADLSVYQNPASIDYDKLSAQIDFAILRAGYRGYGEGKTLNNDQHFNRHCQELTKRGVPVGVYWYSTAATAAEAQAEAECTLGIIQGKQIALPVYIDIEDAHHQAKITQDRLTDVALAFCDTIRAAGYTPGVYANEYWFTRHLDFDRLSGVRIWMAKWSDTRSTMRHDVWQYTDKGRLDGYSGDLDLNRMYPLDREDTMRLTARLSHFADFEPNIKVGGTVNFGDAIGTMGYTGLTIPDDVPGGTHVHVDVVEGEQYGMYYLADLLRLGAKKEYLDDFLYPLTDLVGCKRPVLTGGWGSYTNHYAGDVAGDYSGHQPKVLWPLKAPGKILKVHRKDDNGHGMHIQIAYDYGTGAIVTPQDIEEVNMQVKFTTNVNIRTEPSAKAPRRTDLPVKDRAYTPNDKPLTISKTTIREGYLWGGYQPNDKSAPFSWVALVDLVKGDAYAKDVSTKR